MSENSYDPDAVEVESLRDIVVELEQKLLLAREGLHAIKELEVHNIKDFSQARVIATDILNRIDGVYIVSDAGEA